MQFKLDAVHRLEVQMKLTQETCKLIDVCRQLPWRKTRSNAPGDLFSIPGPAVRWSSSGYTRKQLKRHWLTDWLSVCVLTTTLHCTWSIPALCHITATVKKLCSTTWSLNGTALTDWKCCNIDGKCFQLERSQLMNWTTPPPLPIQYVLD